MSEQRRARIFCSCWQSSRSRLRYVVMETNEMNDLSNIPMNYDTVKEGRSRHRGGVIPLSVGLVIDRRGRRSLTRSSVVLALCQQPCA